ncbi:MAG: methyltransferase family protein [Acetobacteraceae bacterium]
MAMFKLWTQNFFAVVAVGVLLFAPAGTLAWPQAWVFLVLFFVSGQVIGYWLLRTNPGLLAERLKSPLRDNHAPRDRIVTAILFVAFAAWLVGMGLARGFGQPVAPIGVEVLGAVFIGATFCAWSWVLRENSFAVTSVRLQPERRHAVISTGPYALVRHPMYGAAAGFFIGTPLLLGSPSGLLGLLVFMPLLALRAQGEEAILISGLPGYREYAATVRYRLLPGIW